MLQRLTHWCEISTDQGNERRSYTEECLGSKVNEMSAFMLAISFTRDSAVKSLEFTPKIGAVLS